MSKTKLFACAVITALACGCGDRDRSTIEVRGLVRHKGSPLFNVVVVFDNQETGISRTITTDADGRFTIRSDGISGLPVGSYKVALQPAAVAQAVGASQPMTFSGPAKLPPSPIAKRDRSIATTRLTANVKTGINDFVFDVRP